MGPDSVLETAVAIAAFAVLFLIVNFFTNRTNQSLKELNQALNDTEDEATAQAPILECDTNEDMDLSPEFQEFLDNWEKPGGRNMRLPRFINLIHEKQPEMRRKLSKATIKKLLVVVALVVAKYEGAEICFDKLVKKFKKQ